MGEGFAESSGSAVLDQVAAGVGDQLATEVGGEPVAVFDGREAVELARDDRHSPGVDLRGTADRRDRDEVLAVAFVEALLNVALPRNEVVVVHHVGNARDWDEAMLVMIKVS